MKTNFLLSVLAAVLLLWGCQGAETPAKERVQKKYCMAEDFKETVTMVAAEKHKAFMEVPLSGTVETSPDKVVHFVSLVGGVITSSPFSLGDDVQKGQVLAEIRSAELLELESQLRTTTAQIAMARKKLESVQSMFGDGISSEKELLSAQSQLEMLEAELEKIDAYRNLYGESTPQGTFQIKSPRTGIVTAKNCAVGTQVRAYDDILFTISDLSEVWVLANVHTRNFNHIYPGVEVTISTLPHPDRRIHGTVSAITPILDEHTKVLKARIELANPDLDLKPGMSVEIQVHKPLGVDAVSIPADALIFEDNEDFVVVYKGDCDLQYRKVEVLTQNNGTTFLSSGLGEGETIVTSNQLLIFEEIKDTQN